MGFYVSNLDNFDPMKDEVSWAPFSEAREIVWRARYLLRERSSSQVRWLASELDASIDNYFDVERHQAISAIESDGLYELLETDEAGRFQDFAPEAFESYDIKTSENTRSIDAAKEVVESMGVLDDPDIPDPKEYEYFAAMALTMVAGYVQALNSTFDFKQLKRVPRTHKNYEPHEISRFGSDLIAAMEAVTYAESVKKMLQLKELTEATIDRAETLTKEGVKKGMEQIKLAETEKRRAWGKIGKEKSLIRRNLSRDAVLAQHDQFESYQKKSIASAAADLWQWLSQEAKRQDLDIFSVATIEGWISSHRKSKATS